MSWITLRTAIKTKLDTLSGLGMIDDKYHDNITGYPAVMFEPGEDANHFYTNVENEHIYTFELFVVQEMESSSIGRDEAIRILGGAIDTVVNAFDSYQTIGGNCDWSEAAVTDTGESSIGSGMAKWARITLKCHKLKTVT